VPKILHLHGLAQCSSCFHAYPTFWVINMVLDIVLVDADIVEEIEPGSMLGCYGN
jgi:hypothetical protein